MHRRAIIKKLLMGTSLSLWGGGVLAIQPQPSRLLNRKVKDENLYLFTKVLQWVPLEDLPKVVQDMGFNGIDIAVRSNGHFQVKDLKEKLPKLVSGCASLGMQTPILTTELLADHIPQMEEFVKTISGEGVVDFRMGWIKYKTKNVLEELNGFNQQLKELAELHQKHQVQGHYQNHAGNGVGGSVWELLYLLDGIDPRHIGIQYDLRHATVEGYKSWEAGFEVIRDRITTLDIKDFKWKDSSGKDVPVTVPLGKGNVELNKLSQTPEFQSPDIPKILHIEFDLGGAEHGSKTPTMPSAEILSAIKADLDYYMGIL